ncbi:ThiF family protein [Paenibacillus sp. UNC496MF]|uniref:ThiF family adenylyltransferase n=1 Tax=Paenibacillus sp. UNC496MF TaxID=1502753 RepID=UPI0008E54C13|nr:ThiF family adenylyltransferase [Paenibacillus sp. UNC496MF]SFJ63366.1 ThiF family protein [Paenibacillus sp. UNC496MF]
MNVPTLNLPSNFFTIVQIGVGGNGGYLTQRLTKMMYAFGRTTEQAFSYCLVDGDRFEAKNLLRQPCIAEDLLELKSKVLAERYGTVYDLKISYRDRYVESVQDLHDLMIGVEARGTVILLGCVDNHATRKLMHRFFHETKHDIIYLDSGIEAVLPDEPNSGYAGHVVCGVKLQGKVLLEPVGDLYPDILEDDESKLPTESCGDTIVNHPQRMMTNEMAALVMAGYLNTILGEEQIVAHYTNFNAKTMLSKPAYIHKEALQGV